MATSPKSKENLILAEYLERWATDHGLLNDPYVVGLGNALVDSENLAMWASIDPTVFLPHPKVRTEDEARKLTRFLFSFRNVMVFIPLALTWLAISQATRAFQAFLNNYTIATVNFLEFWQNGYEALSGIWRLSNIALADFILVLIVILLTIVGNNIGNASDERYEAAEEELQHERLELALAIKEYLFFNNKSKRSSSSRISSFSDLENMLDDDDYTENSSKPRTRRKSSKPKKKTRRR